MPSVPLDPDQQAAVDHREGACLVLAGPGSGKTRVIVERFLELCASGVGAAEQLVLTYTVKAAAEMRSRAEALHGPFGDEVPLVNFHSFGRRILRQWGWRVGVPASFHIADAAERWLHLEAVLAEMRPRTLWNPLRPHDLVGPLLHLIETAKQELITPEEYAAWAAGQERANPAAVGGRVGQRRPDQRQPWGDRTQRARVGLEVVRVGSRGEHDRREDREILDRVAVRLDGALRPGRKLAAVRWAAGERAAEPGHGHAVEDIGHPEQRGHECG